jgi:hypothetical protein
MSLRAGAKTNGVPHCNAVREAIVKLVDRFFRRSAHDLADHEHSRELHVSLVYSVVAGHKVQAMCQDRPRVVRTPDNRG